MSGNIRDLKTFAVHMAGEAAERRWSAIDRVLLVGVLDPGRRIGSFGECHSTIDIESLTPILRAFVDARPLSEARSVIDDEHAVLLTDDLLELEQLCLEWRERPGRRPRPWTTRRDGRGATVIIVGPWGARDRRRLTSLIAATSAASEGEHRSEDPTWAPIVGRDSITALVVGGPWPGAGATMVVAPGGTDAEVFLSKPAAPTANPTVSPAASPEVSPEVNPPGRHGGDEHARVDPSEHAPEPRPSGPGVEVAVLGRIEVRGVDEALARRPKLTELVVFLAMHPGGARSSAWVTALWPSRRVPQQTVANRLSETRRLLGYAPDDRARLRRNGDIHLLADVTTDWEQFNALASPDAGVASWRKALELVRGRPFEDLSSTLWSTLECVAVEIERTVTGCALRCGEALLGAGDPEGATWAAHQGLRCCPWDERLHRLLMTIADATGNRAGVEAALRHLALVLEIDGDDPLSHVHPETAALYARLVGSQVPSRV